MSKQNDDKAVKISRRGMLKLAAGAAGLTLIQKSNPALALPARRFIHSTPLERIADRYPNLHPPLLVDMQTHVWWRSGGIQKMTPRGEQFLKLLAGSRAGIIGRPVPVADMGRIMFFEDIFLQSETD